MGTQSSPSLVFHWCSMSSVNRGAIRFEFAVVMLATVFAVAGPARGADQRFMLGESIYVGPDETLEEATCVACSIHIEGVVKDSAILILGRLVNEGTIEGDAVVIAGSLESDGSVKGNSLVVAGNMVLRGSVEGDAVTVMGDLRVEDPSVAIAGSAVTILGNQTGVSPDSVGGSVQTHGGDRVGRLMLSGAIAALLVSILGIFATLITLNWLVFLVIGKQRLETIADTFTGNSPTCFLLGLATCFALGVVGLIVAMLLPVSLPIVLVFVVVSLVGFSGITYGIGRNLFASLKPLLAAQAAAAVIIAIQLLPIVGWLVMVVLWNVGIGAAVLSGFGSATDWLTARAEGRSPS